MRLGWNSSSAGELGLLRCCGRSDDPCLRLLFSIWPGGSPTGRVRSIHTYFSRVAWSILKCAHRATVIHPIDPSKLACFSSLWTGTHVGPTAAVERAHSYRARSGSTGPMWASVQSFYRGGSASKKGTWPLLPLPSEPAHSVKACDPLPGRRHRLIERAARLSRPLRPWR